MRRNDKQVIEHLEMKSGTEPHQRTLPFPAQSVKLGVSVTYEPSLGNPHIVFYQELCPND